jgi:hypothetical protein
MDAEQFQGLLARLRRGEDAARQELTACAYAWKSIPRRAAGGGSRHACHWPPGLLNWAGPLPNPR